MSKAREFLEKYKWAEKIANILDEEYKAELEKIDMIKSSLGNSGLPRSSKINKAVEEQAIKLADMAARVKQAEIQALNMRQKVLFEVLKVPGIEGTVLYEKYILFHTLDQIGKDHGYSLSGIKKVHKRGLEAISKRVS